MKIEITLGLEAHYLTLAYSAVMLDLPTVKHWELLESPQAQAQGEKKFLEGIYALEQLFPVIKEIPPRFTELLEALRG
jgi:hypothetical protein